MLITLENISKSYNGIAVLDGVSLTVEDNDRIGLIGANGCGKSTLLKIITGETAPENMPEPDIPRISAANNLSIGYLEQDAGLDADNSVTDEMRSVFSELNAIKDRIRELEILMSEYSGSHAAAEYLALSDEYSVKTALFEARDGYLIDVKINAVLNGMGFPEDTREKIIKTLSGGEKTRLALCKLLLENPSLLILDEPTNHLDFKTIAWLEDYLKGYRGALLIVSHDRYFLDRLTTSICEIQRGRLRRYKGNYTAFTALKKAWVERAEKEYEADTQEREKLIDFARRNITRASTSGMAKSRLKKLDAMEVKEKPVTHEKRVSIKFESDLTPGFDLLSLKNLEISAGGKILAENLSLELKRGERLGIIGENGTGKTTLLKMMTGLVPITYGTMTWAPKTRISYFDQENSKVDFDKTLIDGIQSRFVNMSGFEARSALGRVGITGDSAFKTAGAVSGGERVKLCLAILALERGNVMILDEPTNHLDVNMREVLEQALCDFKGTIIFVSHDRYLLGRLATKIIEFEGKETKVWNCGFEEYQESVRAASADDSPARDVKANAKAASDVKETRSAKEARVLSAKRRQRIKELERLISEAKEESDRIQEEIALPEVCADYVLVSEKLRRLEELKNLTSDYEDEWLAAAEDE